MFEFSIPVSNGDIAILEQIKATNIGHNMKGYFYNKRIEAININTLKIRQTRDPNLQIDIKKKNSLYPCRRYEAYRRECSQDNI